MEYEEINHLLKSIPRGLRSQTVDRVPVLATSGVATMLQEDRMSDQLVRRIHEQVKYMNKQRLTSGLAYQVLEDGKRHGLKITREADCLTIAER